MSIRKPTDAEMLIAMRSYVAELEKQIAEHPGQVERAYKEGHFDGWDSHRGYSTDGYARNIEQDWLNSAAYARLKGEKE